MLVERRSVGGDEGARLLAEPLEGPCFLAACSRCGATRVVGLDPFGLDADFVCGLSGIECEGGGGTEAGTEAGPRGGASLGAEDCGAKGPTEEGWQQQQQQPDQRGTQQRSRGPRPQAGDAEARVRYLNGEVVSRKGERYVVQQLFPELGPPGCSIGGIIGSHKLGRRGLGFNKRPAVEVDRVCLSNKQRAHVRRQPWCTSVHRSPGTTHPKFRAS